jgi:hypothetical protein
MPGTKRGRGRCGGRGVDASLDLPFWEFLTIGRGGLTQLG